jgi:hypothetical protein
MMMMMMMMSDFAFALFAFHVARSSHHENSARLTVINPFKTDCRVNFPIISTHFYMVMIIFITIRNHNKEIHIKQVISIFFLAIFFSS